MAKITELDAAIDNLLKNYKTPEEILGENGLLKQLTKAVLQRALQAEMTHHLGHEKHGVITSTGGNARNGSSAKTIKGDFGLMPLEIPRDRDSSFEPIIVPKGQTRFRSLSTKMSHFLCGVGLSCLTVLSRFIGIQRYLRWPTPVSATA